MIPLIIFGVVSCGYREFTVWPPVSGGGGGGWICNRGLWAVG